MKLLKVLADYCGEQLDTDKFYSDLIPVDVTFPFCALSLQNTEINAQPKLQNPVTFKHLVQFDIWAATRADAEAVLTDLDNVLIPGEELTIPNRQHLSNTFVNRRSFLDAIVGKDAWHGELQIICELEKRL